MKARILAAMMDLAGTHPDVNVLQYDVIAAAIVERAEAEQLDPLLLTALAFHESRFKVGAVNKRTRCKGLFQLSPYWLRGGRLPFVVSVDGGSRAALEVAQGARVLRIYADKAWADDSDDWAATLGAWHRKDGKRIPTKWSRVVVRTWRNLAAKAVT